LTPEKVDNIKRAGCVVIKDVVDDAEVLGWKASLEQFIRANPTVPGKSPRQASTIYNWLYSYSRLPVQ
jgi:Protein of unknown function (DUF1479)